MFYVEINSQTFVKRQGKATDVAISKKDGSVYVVGTSKNVFKYNTTTKRFSPFGPQTRDVSRIAMSKLNQIFASKINGAVYRSNGSSSWTAQNAYSDDVSTDKVGKLWVAMKKRGGDIQKYDYSWKRPLKAIINVDKVAPIGDNTVWVVMKDKSIKKYENDKWNNMPGAALDITVDTKTADVYVIGTSKRIFKWKKRDRKWVPLKNTRKDFTSLDAQNGKLWAIASDKSIYEYIISQATETNTDSGSQSNTIKDYSGTYRIHVHKLLGNYGNRDYYGTAGVYLEAQTKSGRTTIKPQNNQPNRYLDISRNNVKKIRKERNVVNGRSFDYAINIDRIREFKLLGEAANDDAVFDFQFNIKLYGPMPAGLFGDQDGWVRKKIKVEDIESGKKMIYNSLTYSISYTITKI